MMHLQHIVELQRTYDIDRAAKAVTKAVSALERFDNMLDLGITYRAAFVRVALDGMDAVRWLHAETNGNALIESVNSMVNEALVIASRKPKLVAATC